MQMPGSGVSWIGVEEGREVFDVHLNRWLFRYGDENDQQFKRKAKCLEEEVAELFGVRDARAVISGAAAPIAALSASGIRAGDEVIVLRAHFRKLDEIIDRLREVQSRLKRICGVISA